MLPQKILDDELFEQIIVKARKGINKYYPEWTDYNLHDPGITLIELFAWLKEIQQYHLDQISNQSRKKFLQLLGIVPLTKKAALSYVKVNDLEDNLILPQGTRLMAEHVPFETLQREFLTKEQIEGVYTLKKSGESVAFDKHLTEGGNTYFHLFGEKPEAGDAFYILLSGALPHKETHHLYIEIFDGYGAVRNKPNKDFVPLAQIKWEYYGQDGWQRLNIKQDNTFQFLQDGRIIFSFEKEMKRFFGEDMDKDKKETEGTYLLRAALAECNYDVAPILTGIHLSMIPVVQKNTLSQFRDFRLEEGLTSDDGETVFTWGSDLAVYGLSEIYVGKKHGDGPVFWERIDNFRKETDPWEARYYLRLPSSGGSSENGGHDDSRYDHELSVRLVCFEDSFLLARVVGEGDGFPYQRFSLQRFDLLETDFQIMIKEAGGFVQWENVEDFDRSGPESRHYILEESTGEIIFGDCEQGLAPEGEILIIGCSACQGQNGNVKEERINAFARAHLPVRVYNPMVASGGAGQETIDEAFIRLRRELSKVERAVTYNDYEKLVRATPGLMIRSCKAIPVSKNPRRDGSMDENEVSIVVQPFTDLEMRKLNPAYLENIHRQLENKHLLGTRVSVLSPEYAGIRIYGEILAKPYYHDARERIRLAVETLFSGLTWDFGQAVLYSTIYGTIDTLECVAGIQTLTVDAYGKGITRNINGDVLLPQNGIAYLLEAEYVITAGE